MLQVLFVCAANIVRSTTFEAYTEYLLEQSGDADRVHIDSCGALTSTAGSPPSGTMCRLAEKEGVTIEHIAKPFIDAYFDQFDAIFAVDRSIFQALFERAPSESAKQKLHLTAEFSNDETKHVANPYAESVSYEAVWTLIKVHSRAIVEHYIQKKLNHKS